MIEKARAEGLKITADMYTYPAGATGLDAAMPPWVLDGGYAGRIQAAQGSGDAQEDRARDHHAVEGLGEPLPRGWFP